VEGLLMSGNRDKKLAKQRKLLQKEVSQLLVNEAAKIKRQLYDELNALPFIKRFVMSWRVLLKKL
jgi:hypothetical protein